MIENYLKELDNFILATDEISEVNILRRDLWENDLETIGFYRYKIRLNDESVVEFSERLIEEKGQVVVTKYRIHWQDKNGDLLKRWDNAKHQPEISTFPHHLHDGMEDNVVPHTETRGLELLSKILETIS